MDRYYQGILHCNILCEDRKSAEMGIETEGLWISAVLNMYEYCLVKMASDDPDDPLYNKAVLYQSYVNDSIITDLSFEDAVWFWMHAKGVRVD